MITLDTAEDIAIMHTRGASYEVVRAADRAGQEAAARAEEEKRLAAEEANTKRFVCKLVPGEGFRAEEVESFAPDPFKEEFDVVGCFERFVQEKIVTVVVRGWLITATVGTLSLGWSFTVSLFIAFGFGYWRHRKAQESQSKPVMIL